MTRTALYRQYDDDESLLYVGVSMTPTQRSAVHASRSVWGKSMTKITLEWFDSMKDALAAEAAAIANEGPKFNCRHGQRKRGATPRVFGSADNSALVQEIEDYLAKSGETETAFGYRAVKDNSLVNRLRRGTEPRAKTLQKIRKAMS